MRIFNTLWAGAMLLTVMPLAFAQSTGSISDLAAQPNTLTAGIGARVTFTCRMNDLNVVVGGALVQRLDATGNVTGTLGTMRDDGAGGDVTANDRVFTAILNLYETIPGIVRLRVSAAIQGSARRTLSPVLQITASGTATTIRILSPATGSYLNLSPVQVQGSIGDPSLNVTVNGIAASKSGGNFSASVPLIEGTNTITAVATAASGSSGSSSVEVFLDTTPPRVTINSPVDGGHTTNAAVDVTGIVNDIVVGTVNPQQATVTVNGVPATVSNRTFLRSGVPLVVGPNSIRAEGRDRVGNTYAQIINVVRDPVPAGTATLRSLSGGNQSGQIGTQLPAPLVVQLTTALNQPAVNVPVTFRVAESDGLVNNLPAVVVNSDGQGRAQVAYKLGTRAGAGGNRVEAIATGFQGTALFVASALTGVPAKIVVDSGLNQTGSVGQPLPFPFIAIVTDSGNNRLGGVPVTFNLRTGGGNIAGSTAFSTVTDSDGRVAATLTLGLEEGLSNNVVEANFAGGVSPAAFSASALAPGPVNQTAILGVVLDNSNQPIPNVTIRLFRVAQGVNNVQPVQIGTPVVTDARGSFRVTNAPVGTMKLMADGSTALPGGAWPTLEFDLVTVSGRENTVGSPIYLPRLDQVNRLCVNQTTGGTLTLPQVPGFSLTVSPGAATFPGGARSGCISVTPVNPDKVPMAPGFGQQPRFVVTIQPVGTTFNPPARIQIPNVDGLRPRSKTEMYSYDHDLAAFVAIGSGTVSDDASVIASDPGVGVLKAGWHCGGDPNANGTVADCPTCKWCQNNVCVTDPAQDKRPCTSGGQNGCCVGGACTPNGPALPAANPAATLVHTLIGASNPGTNFGLTVVTIGQQGVTGPDFDVTAFVDGNNWAFRVNRIEHGYKVAINGQGRIDITGPNDPKITAAQPGCPAPCAATKAAVIADLTPPPAGTPNGPPRATYWSSSITQAHENCHVSRFYTTPAFWPTSMQSFETQVEAERIPINCNDPKANSPAGVLNSRRAAWQTLVNNLHGQADAAEIPNSEVACHGVSNPLYTALINAIP